MNFISSSNIYALLTAGGSAHQAGDKAYSDLSYKSAFCSKLVSIKMIILENIYLYESLKKNKWFVIHTTTTLIR